MAYTALYREWRPKTFNNVVGQNHITITLKNQIMNNRIAHAYLFCGTRGTGKTSTAKILAKAVNCLNPKDGEPCNECEICKKINSGLLIDVIELDAASNNGVDKIREIIDSVQYPPVEARYKVYIMDEVHMLSQGAVNAFLKTLEEPPSNVLFILATTDPQKLPVTILSRCQRFDFKRIRSKDIFDRLRNIVYEQGILADDKSLNLISKVSDGAMRDALSILDQAIAMGNKKIECNNVINMLGIVNNDSLLKLTDALIERNIEKCMIIIDDIVFSGKDIYSFIRDMINHMRNIMIVKISNNPEEILDMSPDNIEDIRNQSKNIRIEEIMRNIRLFQEAEQKSKWSKQSRIYLELAIIKICKIEYDTSNEVILLRLNQLEESLKNENLTIKSSNNISKISDNIKNENKDDLKIKENKENNNNIKSELTLQVVKKRWTDILEAFKVRRNMVLYASLITGKVEDYNDGIITIKYKNEYAFNKNRLEKEKNRKIVEEIFSQILKEKVKVEYVVDGQKKSSKTPEKILKDTFGEEVVEVIDE